MHRKVLRATGLNAAAFLITFLCVEWLFPFDVQGTLEILMIFLLPSVFIALIKPFKADIVLIYYICGIGANILMIIFAVVFLGNFI
ncbi:MAG: hypothetical protein L3J50_11855 [Emcibacter sp.]|nr:hypothetical protein [Emcibacter sp.]